MLETHDCFAGLNDEAFELVGVEAGARRAGRVRGGALLLCARLSRVDRGEEVLQARAPVSVLPRALWSESRGWLAPSSPTKRPPRRQPPASPDKDDASLQGWPSPARHASNQPERCALAGALGGGTSPSRSRPDLLFRPTSGLLARVALAGHVLQSLRFTCFPAARSCSSRPQRCRRCLVVSLCRLHFRVAATMPCVLARGRFKCLC